MRRAATIVFASLVGLHCGPDPSPISSSSTFDDTAVAPPPEEPQRPAPRDEDTSSLEGPREPRITSTTIDADGSIYETGTFSGTARFGDKTLRSMGYDDVFLLRRDADGNILWARAAGSAGRESFPRVSVKDGKVKILAMTEGPVDCGLGPMNIFDSEMFFLCWYDVEGAASGGGSFPTGAP